MDTVKTRLEWDRPKARGEGVGCASLIHVGGGARVYKSDGCGTIIKMDDYGRIDLFTGATDMGQGSETVIAQIVAEELGLNVDDIHVIHSDTDICPWDVGAHASRTTFVAGNAARGAARKIKARILELGAKELNAPIEKLVLRRRHIQYLDEPETKLEIGKLLRKAHFNHGGQMLMAEYFYDPANENMGKDFRGNMSMTYTFGTHGVRVRKEQGEGRHQRHSGDRQAGQPEPPGREHAAEHPHQADRGQLDHRHPRVGLLEECSMRRAQRRRGEPGVERPGWRRIAPA